MRCSHRSSPLTPPPPFPRRTRRPCCSSPFPLCAPRGPVVCVPAFRRDAEEEEGSATAALLAEDDGADVSAVVQAHVNVLMAVRRRARAKRISRRWRYRGSTAGRRGNKRRDFAAGVHAILRDYFGAGGLLPI